MTRTALRCYTDYKSPYAYVALAPTYRLEEEFDVALDWLPYTLRIESYLGSVAERNAHQWRRVRYSYMDARRFANQQGLLLKGPRKVYSAYHASAGMLFAKAGGWLRVYNDAVFRAFWAHELDPDDLDDVGRLVERLGGDAPAFRAYAEGPGRTEHDRLQDEAEASGVFGVPTFVLDGELFWGGDRLPLLRERLRERGLSRAGVAA